MTLVEKSRQERKDEIDAAVGEATTAYRQMVAEMRETIDARHNDLRLELREIAEKHDIEL